MNDLPRPAPETAPGNPALAAALTAHVDALRACVRCPRMRRPAVPGYPTVSRAMLIGQAPGRREPIAGRPFAWTAGRTLFAWFREHCGIDEERFRRTVYMTAVCRCFPGETPTGGDRVPDRSEVAACGTWLAAEFSLLRPELVIPVGRLAILQLIPPAPLMEIIWPDVPWQIRGARMRRDSAAPPERRVPVAAHRAGQGLDAPRVGTHPRAPGVSGKSILELAITL